MTSIGSAIKQIPLNNGYFRPQPDLAVAMSTIGLTTANTITGYMYTLSNGAMGPFTPGLAATGTLLNAGGCLLKDMGTQFLSSQGAGNSSPIVFRRVQVVDPTVAGGLATDGVSGIYASGNDSSYNCAYILMGFNGAAPAGPFVRTG